MDSKRIAKLSDLEAMILIGYIEGYLRSAGLGEQIEEALESGLQLIEKIKAKTNLNGGIYGDDKRLVS